METNTTQEIELSVGEHITTAAEKLIAACRNGGQAACKFNGVILAADKNSTIESIVDDFNHQSEEARIAYNESPEGKRAAWEALDRQTCLQIKADNLMEKLPDLNFNDPAVLLDWLCEMEEPRDHIGVRVDVERILQIFCANGYEPNAYCDDEFKDGDFYIHAAWIIGQAIASPYVPLVNHFTSQWKERFGVRPVA